MASAAEVRQWAEAYFAAGYYCAESVVLALARAQGIESALLPRMAGVPEWRELAVLVAL